MLINWFLGVGEGRGGVWGDYTHCTKPFENEQTSNDLHVIMVDTLSISVASVFI